MSQSRFTNDLVIKRLNLPDTPLELYDPIRYTLGMGGKRIRPRLVEIACGLCGGDINEAENAAIALEALHNFTLIHDDIMDNADSRRGFESVHKKWDLSTAILSGDALFAYSFSLLTYYCASENYNKSQITRLLNEFTQAAVIVCEGQARDLSFEQNNDISLDDYILMISQKTAALLKSAMIMGSIIAGASDEQIENAGAIGMYAGLAFQIQDDLLDAIGNPDKFGKKVGGDIIEGKQTYLSILARKLADSEDKHILTSLPGKPGITDSEVKSIIDLYRKYDVIEKTSNEIASIYDKASDLLNFFPDSEYVHEIKALLNQLNVREN